MPDWWWDWAHMTMLNWHFWLVASVFSISDGLRDVARSIRQVARRIKS